MAPEESRPAPWLIAAWPGMGNVAVIVAGYLIRELNMRQLGELPPGEHFDVNEIEVSQGVVAPLQMPRGMFFRWTNTRGGRDLIVFLGEAQPTTGVYRYAQELVDAVEAMGVERVVTFASMASALHPSRNPKVTGVATDRTMLEELRKAEVERLSDGQIGGLNGLLLAAAAERGIPGFCLLAEIPFFATGVPNPKAARAALSVFTVLTGIDVSLDELNKHADAVDRALIDAYERMNAERDGGDDEDAPGLASEEESPEAAAAEETSVEPEAAENVGTPEAAGQAPASPAGTTGETSATPPPAAPPPGHSLDPSSRRRIEQMFEAAKLNRGAAVHLKQELDRLGVFREFENRFLDLFRRAN